jgi:hypothetical protein
MQEFEAINASGPVQPLVLDADAAPWVAEPDPWVAEPDPWVAEPVPWVAEPVEAPENGDAPDDTRRVEEEPAETASDGPGFDENSAASDTDTTENGAAR